MKRIGWILTGIFLIIISIFFVTKKSNQKSIDTTAYYLGSKEIEVPLYNESYEEIKRENRGVKVEAVETEEPYLKIQLEEQEYWVKKENLVKEYQDVVYEKDKYVRTSTTVYDESNHILGLVKKSEKIEITGFDQLEKGIPLKYKIKYQDIEGFVYSKYLVDTLEEASKNYDEENSYQIHLKRGNTQGGGEAGTLDFYPYQKASFKENVMPEVVRSLYLNAGVIKNIDSYIELAKKTSINAFVVDIKDNTAPAYPSKIMEQYSKSNYDHAINTWEEYKTAIQKLKENGFYVIGRITTFKDSYYVTDHKESAIADNKTKEPYQHNGSYWPSAYDRKVWEFNVELAKEAIQEMGFQEIQFDYVRFPDRTNRLEQDGTIDMKNTYDETKAQAIQTFLMYACDQIHELGAYVSADVFGESAHHYVTGYGQYWGAISNIVDVISAMPYPDHFGAYEYGIQKIVWTVPYQLLYTWGNEYVRKRQSEIITPAKVRTWIQAYNTVRAPYVVYDSQKIDDQIRALKDAGLSGGYMTWNAASSLTKYEEIKDALAKE